MICRIQSIQHQLLFGINQGGIYAGYPDVHHARTNSQIWIWTVMQSVDLQSARAHEEMYRILDADCSCIFRQNKPTYLMGVGTPANILEGGGPRCGFL